MDELIAWVAGIMGILLVTGWSLAQQARERGAGFEAVAARFGGTVLRDRLGEVMRVQLDLTEAPVDLEVVAAFGIRPASLRFVFHRPLPARFSVLPEALLEEERRLFGHFHAPLEDEAFDARFVVRGSPDSWVRSVLDQETRAHLIALAELVEHAAEDAQVAWEAGPRGMTLDCRGVAWADCDRLVCLTLFAERLFLRLLAVPRADDGVLVHRIVPSAGTCPVCASPLSGFVRRCARCRAPHHEECWTYLGSCAMYACSCRRSELERAGAAQVAGEATAGAGARGEVEPEAPVAGEATAVEEVRPEVESETSVEGEAQRHEVGANRVIS